ncbi:tellurite resistance TerB C-terminal domain-containing protein [Kroppenstedtia eburnea]|uniref:tellurite resistance TerB C-terminal domain-containing protein n=1 Tax=Kroppenstedtia eburnea TaxID=714067 RepID=UPI003640F0B9
MTEGAQREDQAAKSRELLQRYQLPDSEGERRELLDLLQPILKDESWFQPLYAQNILNDLLAGGKREEMWTGLILSVEEVLESITEIQSRLAEYDISLPQTPRHQLQQDTQTLIQRLQAGKSIRGLYLMLSGRKLRYLVEHPAVDGRPIQTEADAQWILEQLKLEDLQNRLVKRWNTLLKEVEGPSLDPSENRLVARADELLSQLKKIVSIKDRILNLQEKTASLSLPGEFCWTASPSFYELREACQAVDDKLRQEQWETEYKKQTRYLQKLTLDSKAHPICIQLLEAWQQKEALQWEAAQKELVRLQELREKHRQLRELANRLQKAAPGWTARILSQMGTPSPFPDHWLDAWEWKRVHTEVEKVNSLQPENIERKLKEQQVQERRLLGSIVAKSAWREQLLRITEPQKRALVAWKQKIKRIGKGTGKYAAKHRQDARMEMEKCQPAIPVWIMPIDRVIENLDLHNDKFDVVIVDESSQCDLFALSALLRAERAVVVGDDEQISPSAVGTDQEAVYSLIARHLQGVPQANSLDMQSSLYDVATRIFPGKLMLKEHFRCVPEIIQFSNDLSYGGEVIPLRLPTQKDRLEPPVLARRVPGYREDMKPINEPEAEAIVADIQAMLKNPAYNNRTIGVISLLGNDQAQVIENRLREAIGEEQMLKRKIICGDAYAFQGDERDVICLSLVIADNVRFGALVRKDAQQRFNVAASRAKNQMRLYHSVDLEDLNPDDFRYRLLNYCQNPRRVMEKVENAEALCESQFEKDVLRMIIARGYQVRPQVKVGRYRIDLVVEGLTNRLAVECDGDQWHGPDRWEEDMLRQQTLERAGWTFWRVRGRAFYRNRQQAMASLWTKLEEMGIEREKKAETANTTEEESNPSLTPAKQPILSPEVPVAEKQEGEKTFLSRLSPVEQKFLHLFSDRMEITVPDAASFARSNGLMLTLLIDEINEKAFEHLGDLLLEETGQSYIISEDLAYVVRQAVLN